MKRYYIDKQQTENFIQEITRKQKKMKRFCNVSVKLYRGKKYNPSNTVVVCIG